MANPYGDDLAHIHDAGFGNYALHAAQVLLKELRRRHARHGLVIDLGCGSGILAKELSSAGYEVLGIDISESMISLARRRAPLGQFRVESFRTADLPPCLAVTAIGEIFNYLFDSGNTQQALFKVFRRVQQSLSPGGVFLFDVAEPGRVPGPGPARGYREGDGWAVLATADEDRRRRLLTRRITSFRKVGKLYRRAEEVHRLRLYRRAALSHELEKLGFEVRVLSRYGDLQFPPGYVGFLATKK